MNYRRIEPNYNSNDKELEPILTQIAKWHNLTPKTWIPDYKPSNEDIEETIQRIKNTKNKDLFLMVVEDDLNLAQGFIWAYKREEPKDSVMIMSLYIIDEYRGIGLATRLKELLEEWSRLEGVKSIQTTVHYTNHKMIALNEKMGYVPGMVNMTKKL